MSFSVAELLQTAVDAFPGEYARAVPPGDCKEFATPGTAEKVEYKPGRYSDETEEHENRE